MRPIGIYPNESGKRLLRDLYAGEEVNKERVSYILLLVLEPKYLAQIAQWDEAQCRHAANWAYRVHLRASDNRTALLKQPPWLKDNGEICPVKAK